jgi:UDP-N-acetylglucosamine 2-epimerase (non-hydrolysing)
MGSDGRRQRIATVLGTRPEIIKCAAVIPLLDVTFNHLVIHTGQHYDEKMDRQFFEEMNLRLPDYNLGVGSGSHGAQLGRMLIEIEPILKEFEPDWVFVQGDTNSTLAGALAGAKLGARVVHLEAGCRSFNRAMPEEVNRVIVDHLATLLLAPDDIAVRNLAVEGISSHNVVEVGSTGIDACLRMQALTSGERGIGQFGVESGSYLVATIHRAENTVPERLAGLLEALDQLSQTWPVLFPVHPRTQVVFDRIGRPSGIIYLEPVGYTAMIALLQHCRALLTDSGGLQEEAAVLGTPTFILRDETEWMAFVEAGRHQLAGTDPGRVVRLVRETLVGGPREQRMRQPIGLERAGASERVVAAIQAMSMEMEGTIGWRQPAGVA